MEAREPVSQEIYPNGACPGCGVWVNPESGECECMRPQHQDQENGVYICGGGGGESGGEVEEEVEEEKENNEDDDSSSGMSVCFGVILYRC